MFAASGINKRSDVDRTRDSKGRSLLWQRFSIQNDHFYYQGQVEWFSIFGPIHTKQRRLSGRWTGNRSLHTCREVRFLGHRKSLGWIWAEERHLNTSVIYAYIVLLWIAANWEDKAILHGVKVGSIKRVIIWLENCWRNTLLQLYPLYKPGVSSVVNLWDSYRDVSFNAFEKIVRKLALNIIRDDPQPAYCLSEEMSSERELKTTLDFKLYILSPLCIYL